MIAFNRLPLNPPPEPPQQDSATRIPDRDRDALEILQALVGARLRCRTNIGRMISLSLGRTLRKLAGWDGSTTTSDPEGDACWLRRLHDALQMAEKCSQRIEGLRLISGTQEQRRRLEALRAAQQAFAARIAAKLCGEGVAE